MKKHLVADVPYKQHKAVIIEVGIVALTIVEIHRTIAVQIKCICFIELYKVRSILAFLSMCSSPELVSTDITSIRLNKSNHSKGIEEKTLERERVL